MADFTTPFPMVPLFGTLTADPKVETTRNQKRYTTFSIAFNDPENGKDEQGKPYPTYVDVTAWGRLGENLAVSLHKGDRFVGIGKLRSFQSKFQALDDNGQVSERKVGRLSVNLTYGGPELTFASAAVTKNPSAGGQGNAQAGYGQAPAPVQPMQQPVQQAQAQPMQQPMQSVPQQVQYVQQPAGAASVPQNVPNAGFSAGADGRF